MKKVNRRGEKGQTLIEVVVTIGVALVIIGSLVVLINASSRRATLARQATQASKLAQEGMEIVRNIRDVDAAQAVKIGTSCVVAPYCSFDDLYSAVQLSISGQLQKPPTPNCPLTNSYCLISGSEAVTLGSANYTRVVTISDSANPIANPICATGSTLGSSDIKKVTVSVTWQSPIGSQERKVESCLRRKD